MGSGSQVIEEPHASAQEQRDDTDLDLVELSGTEQLLGADDDLARIGWSEPAFDAVRFGTRGHPREQALSAPAERKLCSVVSPCDESVQRDSGIDHDVAHV
jgi:hypothetical protein